MSRAEALRQEMGRLILWWRSQPGRVDAALHDMALPRVTTTPSLSRVTVAAVQMRFDLMPSAAAYARTIARLVAEAVLQGAQFVCFPEYTGACLVGLLPGIDKLVDGAARDGQAPSLDQALASMGITLGDLLRYVGPAAWRVFDATARLVARRCNVYLLAGTLPGPAPDGKLHNMAHLYAPDGQHIGAQPKLHAYTTEHAWLDVGQTLHVFELPFGRVAMPVCMDFTYWETARLASLLGVDILVNPSADDHGDSPWLQARGTRSRVQEANAYGIQVNIVAPRFGLNWSGRSAVFAPLGLLPAEQGDIVAQVADPWEEAVLVADLDVARLREFRQERAPDWNTDLYRRHFGAF
jgi:predicted amidohydrolase